MIEYNFTALYIRRGRDRARYLVRDTRQYFPRIQENIESVILDARPSPKTDYKTATMMRKLDNTAGACTCALGMGANSSYEMELAVGDKALVRDKQRLFPRVQPPVER